jgi:hypothetical protein
MCTNQAAVSAAAAVCLIVWMSASALAQKKQCVIFVGDISLSRGVARELKRKAVSPWRDLRTPFADNNLWIGNLEGALQAGPCLKYRGPCLPIDAKHLSLLGEAPFGAVSLANNHSRDFSEAGLRLTIDALHDLGIAPLTEEAGPVSLQVGHKTWALVAINLINRNSEEQEISLLRARLQIGLARAMTPRVVVLVHWGREHDEKVWAMQEQAVTFSRYGERSWWSGPMLIGSRKHVLPTVP